MNRFSLVLLLIGGSALAQSIGPIGGRVSAPRPFFKPQPTYSEEARSAAVNTSVTLSVVVRENGTTAEIKVLRSAGFGLDEKAIEAVRAWQFEPAMKDGKPVNVLANVVVNFKLGATPLSQNYNDAPQARLTFNLPPGLVRPELIKGKIPAGPNTTAYSVLRIAFIVNGEGKPKQLRVTETTNILWAGIVLHELESWRFSPPPENVEGMFEIASGQPPPANNIGH